MRPRSSSRARPTIGLCVVAAVAIGLLLVCVSLLRLPKLVPRLTVVNPTVYQVHLDLSDTRRSGHLDLGVVERESTKVLEETIDQGPTWVFSLSYGGVRAGEVVIARSELETYGWKITIPPEVAERLHDAGVASSTR